MAMRGMMVGRVQRAPVSRARPAQSAVAYLHYKLLVIFLGTENFRRSGKAAHHGDGKLVVECSVPQQPCRSRWPPCQGVLYRLADVLMFRQAPLAPGQKPGQRYNGGPGPRKRLAPMPPMEVDRRRCVHQLLSKGFKDTSLAPAGRGTGLRVVKALLSFSSPRLFMDTSGPAVTGGRAENLACQQPVFALLAPVPSPKSLQQSCW